MNLPFADTLLRLFVRHQSRRDPVRPIEKWRPEAAQRILLVLTTGLGDAILSCPVFSSLRKALPKADIRLFCRAAWAPLFDNDPALNGVIRYQGKYRHFLATVAALREFAPDTCVVLHGNDPDILPLAYLCGSRFIARIPTSGTKFPFLLSNAGRAEDRGTIPGWHYIENRLRILATLGIPAVSSEPVIHIAQAACEAMAARLAARLEGKPYWVLHAFSADAYKVWPVDKAAELIREACRQFPDHAVLLTGSSSDRPRLEALIDAEQGTVINVAGEFNIADTAACLANAKCVVAPDTGVLHLAAALGVPVVGLYAPTSAALVGPRSARTVPIVIQKPQTCDPCLDKRCPYTPKNCMDQIGVDEVLAGVTSSLAKTSKAA